MKDLISLVWKGISKTRYKKWSKLRNKDINIHIQVLFQKKRLNVPLLQNMAAMKTSLKSQMAGSIMTNICHLVHDEAAFPSVFSTQ